MRLQQLRYLLADDAAHGPVAGADSIAHPSFAGPEPVPHEPVSFADVTTDRHLPGNVLRQNVRLLELVQLVLLLLRTDGKHVRL